MRPFIALISAFLAHSTTISAQEISSVRPVDRNSDNACGPKCIHFILREHFKNEVELFDVIRENDWENLANGVTIRELAKALQYRQYLTELVIFGPNHYVRTSSPAIILLDNPDDPEFGHFVVLMPNATSQLSRVWDNNEFHDIATWQLSQSSKGVALLVGDKDKSKIDYCINRTFDSSIATVCRMSLLVTLGFIVIVVVRRWWGPRISSGDRDPPVVATSPTSHRGVSLIELMVVVSIIGVLAGLILSSVQMVRSTAVRTTCQNNLRQIAIGTLASHDVLGSFPAGLSYQSEHHRFKYMGWTARILPFIEQDIIWADIEKTFRSDPNPEDLFGCRDQERLLNTRIKAFVCPSDGHDRIHRSRYFDPGFTWYLGNHGTDHAKLDGILFKDSRVRISDIADGTTNTILIGERPPAQSGQFGWWYRGLGQRKDGSADMILSVRELNVYFPNCPPGPYSFVRGNPENNCDSFHFWSLHPNGANFVMADGSVKLLAYSVDHLMPILATRSGREVVPNLD